MSPTTPSRQVIFDPPPEIFATDSAGCFTFPLLNGSQEKIQTADWDEVRFVFSLWYPSNKKSIDLDRAYVELQASLDPNEEHWVKLAEVEPVVPAYNVGDRFEGWIVLPILAEESAYSLVGRGFEQRSRIQLRTSAYFVA